MKETKSKLMCSYSLIKSFNGRILLSDGFRDRLRLRNAALLWIVFDNSLLSTNRNFGQTTLVSSVYLLMRPVSISCKSSLLYAAKRRSRSTERSLFRVQAVQLALSSGAGVIGAPEC